MSLAKIKNELQQMKEILEQSSNSCSCLYVEIEENEILSSEKQLIIEANQRCFERKGNEQNHAGYSQILVMSVGSDFSDYV